MQISISGKQIDVGSALQSHVNDNLSEIVNKYFERAIQAEVVFSKQSHKHADHYKADINVFVGTGTGIGDIKASDIAADIYEAFNGALGKIQTRLNKYKSKLKDHHKPKLSEELGYDNSKSIKGIKYVLSAEGEEDAHKDNPLIVAEKTTAIETLTVSEAVMRMDLSDLPALLFKNKKNGRLNVVYHRADGNISWVDPQENKAS